ncbi:hypothetical protein Droror1_Dr00026543 [Drosera rotundifolia]
MRHHRTPLSFSLGGLLEDSGPLFQIGQQSQNFTGVVLFLSSSSHLTLTKNSSTISNIFSTSECLIDEEIRKELVVEGESSVPVDVVQGNLGENMGSLRRIPDGGAEVDENGVVEDEVWSVIETFWVLLEEAAELVGLTILMGILSRTTS